MRKTREADDAEKEDEKSTTEKDKETTTEKDKESTTESEDQVPAEEPSRQIILHLTSEPQLLAKNFDLKRLSK